VSVECPDLSHFLAVAATVTESEPANLLGSTKLDLADSALHAPGGSWSDEDFYPDFVDKAAVPLVRLAKNHPLLDGNKRAAWVTLRLFIEMNGWTHGAAIRVSTRPNRRCALWRAVNGARNGRQFGSGPSLSPHVLRIDIRHPPGRGLPPRTRRIVERC
jgi:death-on-curing protein